MVPAHIDALGSFHSCLQCRLYHTIWRSHESINGSLRVLVWLAHIQDLALRHTGNGAGDAIASFLVAGAEIRHTFDQLQLRHGRQRWLLQKDAFPCHRLPTTPLKTACHKDIHWPIVPRKKQSAKSTKSTVKASQAELHKPHHSTTAVATYVAGRCAKSTGE